jgi:uncharacterized Zn finger protein (UPF0148 family)
VKAWWIGHCPGCGVELDTRELACPACGRQLPPAHDERNPYARAETAQRTSAEPRRADADAALLRVPSVRTVAPPSENDVHAALARALALETDGWTRLRVLRQYAHGRQGKRRLRDERRLLEARGYVAASKLREAGFTTVEWLGRDAPTLAGSLSSSGGFTKSIRFPDASRATHDQQGTTERRHPWREILGGLAAVVLASAYIMGGFGSSNVQPRPTNPPSVLSLGRVRANAEAACTRRFYDACVQTWVDLAGLHDRFVYCEYPDGRYLFAEPGIEGAGWRLGDACHSNTSGTGIVEAVIGD